MQIALHGAFPLGKMKIGRWEKEKRGLVSLRRRGGYPPPMDDREVVCAYFVLSLARSKVTVSFSVSPLRETVSVALSPAE